MLQIVNPKTIKILHRSELTAPAISPTPAEEPANPVATEPAVHPRPSRRCGSITVKASRHLPRPKLVETAALYQLGYVTVKPTAGRTADTFRVSSAELRKAVAHIRAATAPVSEVERAYVRSNAAERDVFVAAHAADFLDRIDRMTAPTTT